MDYSNNKELRDNFRKLYDEAYAYYKKQDMSLKDIELEQVRLESKSVKFNNPGLSLSSGVLILLMSILADIFVSLFFNKYGFFMSFTLTLLLIFICLLFLKFLDPFTDKVNINIDSYAAAIKALEDLKSPDIFDDMNAN